MRFKMKRAFALVVLTCFSTALWAQEAALPKYLKILYSAPAPTGFEQPLTEKITAALGDDAAFTRDSLGSLYLSTGEGETRMAIVAGMDEAGYIVSGIREDGFLTLDRPVAAPHAFFDASQFGHPMVVWTTEGSIAGVLALPSSHILSRERRQRLMDLFTLEHAALDIAAGNRSEALERGIRILDPVTPVKEIHALANGKISGYTVGRRICAAILVESAESIMKKSRRENIQFVWVAQTNILRRGGKTRQALGAVLSTKRLESDRTLIVDTFPCGVREPLETDVGKGPVLISASGSVWEELIKETAANHGIRLQIQPGGETPIMNAYTAQGKEAVGLMLPVRFPDTAAEVVDLADARVVLELLRALAVSGRRQ